MNKRLMQQARECVSRGWCEPETALMQMDSVLAEAIARHVAQAFAELERERDDARHEAGNERESTTEKVDMLRDLSSELAGARREVSELRKQVEVLRELHANEVKEHNKMRKERDEAQRVEFGDVGPPATTPVDKDEALQHELAEVINRHSLENESDTPDFLLAAFAHEVLDSFARVVRGRDNWHSTHEPDIAELRNQLAEAKEREDMLMAEVQGAYERVAELERERGAHAQRVEFGGGRTGGKTVMLTTPDSRIERWNGIQVTHRACGLCRHFVQHMRPDGDQVRLSVTGRCAAHSMPGVDIIVFEHMACADFALGEGE